MGHGPDKQWSKRSLLAATAGIGLSLSMTARRALAQQKRDDVIRPTARTIPKSFGSGSTKIAVLLETQSANFGKAATAVIDGIRSAHSRDGQGTMVDVISVLDTGEDIVGIVSKLPSRGYSFAIGPLTRGGVNTLADSGGLPLPVLALNQPDLDRRVTQNLIIFGLPIETEGRQVARAAFEEMHAKQPDRRAPRALIVSNTSPIGRRSSIAFSDGWRELGGALVDPVETDVKTIPELRSALGTIATDVAFAAVGPDTLRALRATLPKEIRLYSTSQANSLQPGLSVKTPELDGLRLVDMPWQLQPENSAVMAYPKAPTLTHLDFQRLYALGIDSFRLAKEFIANKQKFELEGVTGRLRVDLAADSRIDRTSVLAEYRNGVIVPIDPATATR